MNAGAEVTSKQHTAVPLFMFEHGNDSSATSLQRGFYTKFYISFSALSCLSGVLFRSTRVESIVSTMTRCHLASKVTTSTNVTVAQTTVDRPAVRSAHHGRPRPRHTILNRDPVTGRGDAVIVTNSSTLSAGTCRSLTYTSWTRTNGSALLQRAASQPAQPRTAQAESCCLHNIHLVKCPPLTEVCRQHRCGGDHSTSPRSRDGLVGSGVCSSCAPSSSMRRT